MILRLERRFEMLGSTRSFCLNSVSGLLGCLVAWFMEQASAGKQVHDPDTRIHAKIPIVHHNLEQPAIQ